VSVPVAIPPANGQPRAGEHDPLHVAAKEHECRAGGLAKVEDGVAIENFAETVAASRCREDRERHHFSPTP
jgi:hypothetical protein